MSISTSSRRIGIVKGEELIGDMKHGGQRVSILVDVNDGQQAMAPAGIVTGTFVEYSREEEKREGEGGADQSTLPKLRASQLTGLGNSPIVCTFVIDGRPRTGAFAQLCENVLDADLTQKIFGPQIRLLFQKFFSESGTGTVMAMKKPEQSKESTSLSVNGGVKAATATATTTVTVLPSAHVDPTAKVPQHTESGNTTVPSASATGTSAPSNNTSIAHGSSSQAAPASVPAAVPVNPTRASSTVTTNATVPTISRPATTAVSQPSDLLQEAHQKRLHDLKHDQENKREKRVEAALAKMGGWDRNPLSVQNLRVLEDIIVECPVDVTSGDAAASKAPALKAPPHSVYTRSNGASNKNSSSQHHGGGGMYHNPHHTPFTVSGGGAAAAGSSTGLRQPFVPSSSAMPLPPPPAVPSSYGQGGYYNPMLAPQHTYPQAYPSHQPFSRFQPSPYAVPFSVMPLPHASAATGGGAESIPFGSVGLGTKNATSSYANDNSFEESRVVGSELKNLLDQAKWNDNDDRN